MKVDIRLNPSRKSESIPSNGKPKEMFLGIHLVKRKWQTEDIDKKLLDSEHAKHWFNVEKAGTQSNQTAAEKKRAGKKKTVSKKKTSSKKKTATRKKVAKKETRKAA